MQFQLSKHSAKRVALQAVCTWVVDSCNAWFRPDICNYCGRYGSFGIATSYGLECPGFKPQGEEIFLAQPVLPRGPPSLLYSGHRVSFVGVKRPARRDDNPLPSNYEVKSGIFIPLPPLYDYPFMLWDSLHEMWPNSRSRSTGGSRSLFGLYRTLLAASLRSVALRLTAFVINPHLRRYLPYGGN
jgi:hypothetical protein